MRRTLVATLLLGLIAASCADDESASDSTPTTEAPSTTEPTTTTTSEPPASTSSTSTTTTTAVEPDCDAVSPGLTTSTVASGGNDYELRLFVPETIGDGPAPLVLNWHGLGSNGEQQAGFSLHEGLAAVEGYIVASPTAFPDPTDVEERNSWELPQFDVAGRDDVAFAEDLIDLLVGQYCADPARVYSTGMSNGGLFTSVLVCELNDRIAAAVSVAGVTRADPCAFERGVPFLAIHGTEDDIVPYAGEADRSPLLTPTAPLGSREFLSQVMPDEFGEIAADMGCDPTPVFSEFAADIRAHEYQNCPDGVPVVFYEAIDAGHTWPGSPFADILEDRGLGATTPNYDATADGWAFMSQYSLG
ncbi:MAG: PHB depolymerase family esterase [Actinomycetota bacterium]